MKINIGLYGGSFDPVHLGHLKTLHQVQNYCQFDEIRWLPCKQNQLKGLVHANALHRLEMLKIALQDEPHHVVDPYEIEKEEPSFTIETLKHFRRRYPKETSLTWIMGEDAFRNFDQWHEYSEILTHANLLIMNRGSEDKPIDSASLNFMIKHHQKKTLSELLAAPHGGIFFFDAGEYPISSTNVRAFCQSGKIPQALLPPAVYAYIKAHQLYHV